MPIMIPDPGSVGAGQANIARSVGTPRNVDVGVRTVPQNTAYASPDAFGAGVGAGLRSLGKGIEAVGGDLMSIANDLKNQQATAALMDQEAILEQHRAEYYNKVATQEIGLYEAGENSFRAHMDRAKMAVQQKISEIPATKLPGVSKKLEQNFQQYVALNSTRAARDAVLLQVKDSRQRGLNARELALETGNWPMALETSANMPGTLPADREALVQDVHFRMQQESLAAEMDVDPRGVAQRLAEDEDYLPEVRGIKRIEARRRAESLANQRTADTARRWSVRSSNGDYPTEEEIDLAVELGDIDEIYAEQFKRQYQGAYPDEKTTRAFLELEAAIVNYDPSNDPDKSQLAQLSKRMLGMGEVQRAHLSDLLSGEGTSFASTENYKYGMRIINHDISSNGDFYANATGEGVLPQDTLAPEWEEIRRNAVTALAKKMQTKEGQDMDETELSVFVKTVLSLPLMGEIMKKLRGTEASISGGGTTLMRDFTPLSGGGSTADQQDFMGIQAGVPGEASSTLFPPEFFVPAKSTFVPSETTAYWPGENAAQHGLSDEMEGGPLDSYNNTIIGNTSYEDYIEGKGDYVTVAMDKYSEEYKKKAYLISPNYPGILFRVMDKGGYGTGRGRKWVDIASRDPKNADLFKRKDVTFKVISDEVAERLKRNGGSE